MWGTRRPAALKAGMGGGGTPTHTPGAEARGGQEEEAGDGGEAMQGLAMKAAPRARSMWVARPGVGAGPGVEGRSEGEGEEALLMVPIHAPPRSAWARKRPQPQGSAGEDSSRVTLQIIARVS
jgi:hypothetical protein